MKNRFFVLLDKWLRVFADKAGKRFDSIGIRRRKRVLLLLFSVGLVFLVLQTVYAFLKLNL